MSLMSEFEKERSVIKNAPLNKKVEYFWDYYKIHTIAVIVLIIVVASFIHTYATKTDEIFHMQLINTMVSEDAMQELEISFLEKLGADEKKESVVLDTSMYLNYENPDYNHTTNQQKLVVLVSAGAIDIFAGDEYSMSRLAYDGCLADLREYFNEAEISQYASQFLCIDQVQLDEVERILSDNNSVEELPELVYGHYDELEQPIPVAIYITEGSDIGANVEFLTPPGVMGISTSTTRIDIALDILKEQMAE